jgi:hypothetical protein
MCQDQSLFLLFALLALLREKSTTIRDSSSATAAIAAGRYASFLPHFGSSLTDARWPKDDAQIRVRSEAERATRLNFVSSDAYSAIWYSPTSRHHFVSCQSAAVHQNMSAKYLSQALQQQQEFSWATLQVATDPPALHGPLAQDATTVTFWWYYIVDTLKTDKYATCEAPRECARWIRRLQPIILQFSQTRTFIRRSSLFTTPRSDIRQISTNRTGTSS